MFKKIVIAVVLVLCISLVSCAKTKTAVEAPSYVVLNVETYMSDLSVAKAVHLAPQTGILRHPLKTAIERYGDNYEFSWEGTYARFSFPDAKCSFEICVGAEFEEYDWYNNYIDYNDCNIMEYLNFVPIENIIFDGDGIVLTDGIEIGMSAAEIAEKLGVAEFDYTKCSMKNSAYNDEGKYVQVYTTYGETDDIFYSVVFEDDILASVLISTKSWHLTDDSDGGKAIIDEAFSFVEENDLATFDAADLTYKGKKYSSYYGAWFWGRV